MSTALKFDVVSFERKRVAAAAAAWLAEAPTRSGAAADLGKALRRFSIVMPGLAAGWLVTRKKAYAKQAALHLQAWFVEEGTALAPELKGVTAADAVHLVEVVRAAALLWDTEALDHAVDQGTRKWVSACVTWLTSDKAALATRDGKDMRAAQGIVLAAELARFTRYESVSKDCAARFKALLPQLLTVDGALVGAATGTPDALVALDVLATICQIVASPADDLWTFQTADGRGMKTALAHAHAALASDRNPPRHPALLFGALALGEARYLETWKKVDGGKKDDDLIGPWPVRQPVLWLPGKAARKSGS